MARKKKKAAKPGAIVVFFNRVKEFGQNPTVHAALGLAVIFFSLALLMASISFLFNWQADYNLNDTSFGELLSNPDITSKNIFGTLGFKLAYNFVYRWFGISALLLALFIGALGLRITFRWRLQKPVRLLRNVAFLVLWLMIVIAYLSGETHTVFAGGIGFFLNQWLTSTIGMVGTGILLCFALGGYLVVRLRLTPEKLNKLLSRKPKEVAVEAADDAVTQEPEPAEKTVDFNVEESVADESRNQSIEIDEAVAPEPEIELPDPPENDVPVTVETKTEEEQLTEKEIEKKLKEFGEYDPTLDLSNFKLPTIDLLKDYGQSSNITIDQDELEANKNRIVDTLNNYKIDIAKIKATIGPTVTLYEIVPAAGVRISKIKNLEDDIALSLSALGIRIIAPIPGRGTIGIEVPNKKPKIVSMRNALASEKFQNARMELPVALGKTINNETFVADLVKMPHLLMAGATGQGKSVGLNAMLASILYKKHPAQVKFVLVDPKKVELTLYNHIERHYLAKLPDTEDAIITDTSKVINTLNSLCIEMDARYDLLKSAMVRNIKEYNQKFVQRRLNPEDGHRYLPYIVLVIDEFADLIMTAGKEVETPIARLAQLARAIGIHLIIATQRPSVNVITGIIKANFPARIAFRVTSKIDSRTILDAGGADQLIGKGDMLYSSGNDLIRMQCAFLDTPEVEAVCDYIGSQKAYPTAYELPEYVGEESSAIAGLEDEDRDVLFEDAARIVVIHQQGSASLLQRKLKLGYNRAGRIVDQLEAAGIIGPFEGSKARQVLIPDEMALEQILNGKTEIE
jgi:S-DNA-T family DNA segregation ATPase FtsK/SpoIIIE